ncbi:MAG TPA: histidine kinase [Kineosporiaceae bacterium]|nr:histidine kinase [Kineosporiaceae bacterium]
MSFIGFGTAGLVLDAERLGLGLMPFIGAMGGLPLGLAATSPLLGWAVSASGAFVIAATLPIHNGNPWPWPTPHGLVLLALLGAVTAQERLPRAAGAWAATVILFAWAVPEPMRVGWLIGVTSVAVIGLLAGRLASTRRALSREAEQSAIEKSHRVLLEERARIARDLHDIVAHHMSMVVVQAETAVYQLPGLQENAVRELSSISSSARAALNDTRALLSVLRREDEPAERAPQPDISLLPDLLDDARRVGVDVVCGDLPSSEGLRPGVSLAAYRIVQESVANASRHAPGAPVEVELTRGGHALRVRITNGRPPAAAAWGAMDEPAPAGRHGIVGMRERAVTEGGSLDAAPTPDGGFEVVAVLPLDRTMGTPDRAPTEQVVGAEPVEGRLG